jgi:hypothetical protein
MPLSQQHCENIHHRNEADEHCAGKSKYLIAHESTPPDCVHSYNHASLSGRVTTKEKTPIRWVMSGPRLSRQCNALSFKEHRDFKRNGNL